jgi:5-methylcytosine-specific restriction endonuclease McrA
VPTGPRRRFCSNHCKATDKRRRWGKHDQRAKRLGQPHQHINRTHVFVRDRWTCHLCGIRTPPALRGKNQPNSPELDHIIPLAKGGGHLYANVACACRACNSAKGSTILGQFRLL